MSKIPQNGELYKIICDINSPKYEIRSEEVFGSYSAEKEIVDWHRLKKGDLLLYIGAGKNLGTDNIPANRIASIRADRNYSFRVEKIEQYFIWQEKFVTIVLTPEDWQFLKKIG